MPRSHNSRKNNSRGDRGGSRKRGSHDSGKHHSGKNRSDKSHSHSHSKSRKDKKKKRKNRSHSRHSRHSRRSRSPEVRAFGSETLSFAGGGINANQCQKKYLNVNSEPIFAAAVKIGEEEGKADGLNAAQIQATIHNITTNEANNYTNSKRACEVCAIAALCTRSLVITWAIEPDDKDKNNKENGFKDVSTIYTIIIERVQGCKGEPILKFQVPCTQVDVDECPPTCTSQLLGSSQVFKVDVAAGTLLRAAVIQTLLDPCKKKPCDPDDDKPEPKATGIEAITVDLYLF